MMRSLLAAAAFLSVWTQYAPAQKQPFTVDALWRIARISEPQLSPDGQTLAFTVERPDVEKNTRPKQIYTVRVFGGAPMQITSEGTTNQRPRWTPDGRRIVFLSNRSGSTQIWSMNPDGSDAKQITNFAAGASGVTVSPDGQHAVFTTDVYPECSDQPCNDARFTAEKDKVKPRVYTSLLYRHWNEWQSGTRKHLMSAPIDGGMTTDLAPGQFDVPTFSLGGADDYAISPDGKEVAYVVNTDPEQARSTNTDIYVVPITGGEAKKITISPGADRSPSYSPDGKYLAFRSQERAGYESDRWRLVVLERSTGRALFVNESEDRNVEEMTWSPDSTRLFYTIEDRGRTQVKTIPATGGGSRAVITGSSHIGDMQFTPDGKTMVYTEQSASKPVEIFRTASTGGSAVALTHLNDALLSEYALTAAEELWVKTADGNRVHSFIVRPPGFSQSRKYPVLLLIHGGPQGAWGESWSYRWNPQVFAGAGFLVVMPNPRGSTGYGQKFTDEINQDWGGRPYEDLMAVVDRVAALPYTDAERMAAAGGSYGGYMVNWLLGHTDRFKAFVSHAGVFDLRSMVGETEELWFPLWEFRGMPWDNPELYAKLSPSFYVSEFKTPTLVMHGERDYRVPVGQGLQLFTALQTRNVPSKLVLFPDEGHWILQPQNSLLWYRAFLDWIGEWTRKPPANPTAIQ
jgi:dipeptidyl aminopeptidase/acylaminoacyl peptidase